MRHDLKAPLTGIIGLPRILLDEGGLSPGQESLLTLIEESGLKMLSMINRSLDLFKMERGTYVLRPEPVDVIRLVRRIFLEFGVLAAQSKVTFAVTREGRPAGESDGVVVSGERLLLHSMLANCVKNALEASPPGERVSVDVSVAACVVIRICNRGVVPPAIRDTFFRKFATAGKVGGTGLGAYSARLVVEAHGGTIGMETSDDTATTTITIALPATAGCDASAGATDRPGPV